MSTLRHGHTYRGKVSRAYKTWMGLRSRCEYKRHPQYHNYGARGIRVCDRWRQFENFLADMGEPPEGMSIDRINNDGDYSPDNCRWATIVEQRRNTRINVLLTFRGKEQCVAAWAEEVGLSRKTLQTRLRRGWPVERALFKVVRK